MASLRTDQLAASQLSASAVMLAAGTSYAFSLFGPQLSATLNLSQSETALIANCGNAGVSLGGPIVGYLIDAYPDYVALLLAMGACLIFSGYSLIAFTYEGAIERPHYAVIGIYFLLVGLGSALCYHTALATNYRNFPASWRSLCVHLC